MALEKKNINIPISGGVNQGEDGYLLKPPYLDVINGWYDKEGSIKKRGAYQFIQAGFTGKAVPFTKNDVLHIVDESTLYRSKDPATVETQSLGAYASFLPAEVLNVGNTSEGAREVVSAQGQFETVVVWTQPIPPDPDGSTGSPKLQLWAAAYDNSDLTTPTKGPFRILDSSAPVLLEEIGLEFSGGWFCLYGISPTDGAARYVIFTELTQALNFSTIGLTPVKFIDCSPISTSFYFVVQEQQDASNATASLRDWGRTVGFVGSVSGGSLSLSSAVLGTVAASPDYVGEYGVAIYADATASRLYFAVASVRTETVKVFHTDLSLGSKSSAVTVVTHADETPWVSGGYGSVLDATLGGRYPAHRDTLIDTTARVGRLAICQAENNTSVVVFWCGPVVNTTVGESFAPFASTNPTVTGIGWKEVSNALAVGSSTGVAACSWLHSKPRLVGGRVYCLFSMALLSEFAGDFSEGTPGLLPDAISVASRDAAWKMAQLCRIGSTDAVPVSQWGADRLTDFAWCLSDVDLTYDSKGTNEVPIISSRRPVPLVLSYDSSKFISTGTHLVRNDTLDFPYDMDPATLPRVRLDANRLRPVLVTMSLTESSRSSVAVLQDKILLGNGWLSVIDSSGIREASPNFIPALPTGRYSTTATAYGTDGVVYVSWMIVDGENKLYRSSLSPEMTLVGDNGASPARPMDTIVVANQPPSISRANSRARFEVWQNGEGDFNVSTHRATAFDPTKAVTRAGVFDPIAFTSSGPWRYLVSTRRGDGLVTLPGAGSSALQPEPLGGCSYVTTTSNRVWYVEPEDTARVRFSMDFSVLGSIQFNRNLYIDIPDGSKPVAVASLDEQVVILTDKSIYLVTGNLPNNNGGGANFYLQRVAFEGGCSNRYSVFSTRQGVFFESERGLNLLTRGYEVLFAGEAIEDSVSGGSSITGTAYLPAHDLYLFTTSSDIMALRVGQSFKWTRWDFEHDQDIVASCAWGDYHVVLGSDGDLFYMDMDVVTDVLMTLTTPWIYLGDLEGFQRVRNISLVGRNDTVSPVGYAAVQIGYDFATSYAETLFYEYGVDITGSPLRIRMKPARGKCSSFRLRFAETAETVGQSTTNDSAITIAGISVEAGIKMLGIKNPRNSTSTPS